MPITRAQQAYWDWKKAVVSAVQEVDDSLGNYAAQQDSLTQLGVAVKASRRAVELATQRYEDGLTDFLNVLDAQRQLFDLEDQYAASQQTMIYDFISLYKALGGGWEGFEGPPLYGECVAASHSRRRAQGTFFGPLAPCFHRASVKKVKSRVPHAAAPYPRSRKTVILRYSEESTSCDDQLLDGFRVP